MDALPDIDLKKPEPAYRQIEKALRKSIANGEMAPGMRLPDVRSLAKRYGTSVYTIHTALVELEGDGLVSCTRRRGTFVTGTHAKLRRVGVYFGRGLMEGRSTEFYRELNQILDSHLADRDAKTLLWVDGRPGRQEEPLTELARAVAQGEVQGIIATAVSPPELRWLQDLGLPLAAMTTGEVPFQVTVDHAQAIDLAFDEFRRMGCKTIGAIFPFSINSYDPRSGRPALAYQRLFEHFTNQIADSRLETRNSWVRLSDRMRAAREHEEYGYRQFREIWSQAERPEGLLVWPDTVARGSLAAMLELGVRVPHDLKLVIHRNEGVPILCPYPAANLILSPTKMAEALILQLERQLAGKVPEPIQIPVSLQRAHSSCPTPPDPVSTPITPPKK